MIGRRSGQDKILERFGRDCAAVLRGIIDVKLIQKDAFMFQAFALTGGFENNVGFPEDYWRGF